MFPALLFQVVKLDFFFKWDSPVYNGMNMLHFNWHWALPRVSSVPVYRFCEPVLEREPMEHDDIPYPHLPQPGSGLHEPNFVASKTTDWKSPHSQQVFYFSGALDTEPGQWPVNVPPITSSSRPLLSESPRSSETVSRRLYVQNDSGLF